MKHFESIKRITVLQLAGVGILANIIAYAYVWYKYYIFDVQVVFWRRGNWVVVGIYAILIMFFMMTYGGNKIGYLKPFEVFLSQVLAILASNLITYLQLSVMVVWFANIKPIGLMTLAQILFALFWVYLSNFIYRNVFPPRMLLLIHGDHDTEDIKRKFDSRKGEQIPNAYIQKMLSCCAGNENAEVIYTESMLTDDRKSASAAITGIACKKRLLESIPKEAPEDSPYNIRENNRNRKASEEMLADIDKHYEALSVIQEHISDIHTVLDERVERTRNMGMCSINKYIEGVRSGKLPEYDPEITFFDNAVFVYLRRHEEGDKKIRDCVAEYRENAERKDAI